MNHEDLVDAILHELPAPVERIDTHISTVLLTEHRAYKIKKPVDLGFLDYSTPTLRHRFCWEEIRLNRRLAAGDYLGVAPLLVDEAGRVTLGDCASEPMAMDPSVADYAVVMRRLPAERMLDRMLARGEIDRALLERLCALLVEFHARCRTGDGVDEWGRPDEIRRQLDANLAELDRRVTPAAAVRIGTPGMLARIEAHLRGALSDLESVIDRRVANGRVREGHGDLHAGNICVLEDRIVAYDCIEFDPRFRCRDVACEIAFLAMDLDAAGFSAFAEDLVRTYAERAGDDGVPAVVPFHKMHLAVVRAKVAAIRAEQSSASDEAELARREGMRYLQLAVRYALPAGLVLMCGLPGSGKSHVARAVAGVLGAEREEADLVRKRLAGLAPGDRTGVERGIYRPEFTARTYAELLRRAREALGRGRSVVVDATLPARALRAPFLALAEESGVAHVVVQVACDESIVRERLRRRVLEDDATSDADWDVYRRARDLFEPPDEVAPTRTVVVDGAAPAEDACELVLDRLMP